MDSIVDYFDLQIQTILHYCLVETETDQGKTMVIETRQQNTVAASTGQHQLRTLKHNKLIQKAKKALSQDLKSFIPGWI